MSTGKCEIVLMFLPQTREFLKQIEKLETIISIMPNLLIRPIDLFKGIIAQN